VVATLTSPVRWLGNILLLAVIFLAYDVRRFGQRFAALGLAAILSFLITLSTHAEAAQRPWLVITAGVVTGFAYLFRFVIPPPRPTRVLRQSIAAFTLRAATASISWPKASRVGAQPRRNGSAEASSSCISARG
jgi:hypothetical protein